jgi:hypothetical protein
MQELECDVLIVGGGTGGCAAALAACSMGYRVVMTEETDWIGGQLTAQAVPPDEHPWVEQFGITRRYHAYRSGVRRYYRRYTPMLWAFREDPFMNPGGGWVSRLCHEPAIGWQVLNEMMHPYIVSGRLQILLKVVPVEAYVHDDHTDGVGFVSIGTRTETRVYAPFVLDATEVGDLLRLSGTEYVTGAESRYRHGEPSAPEGPDQPQNMQAITWVFAMAHDEGSNRVIDKPEHYAGWRDFKPSFWPGPLLGATDLNPVTNQPRNLPFWGDDLNFFSYRQILEPSRFESDTVPHPVTIVNWPMNDYFLGSVIDVDDDWSPAACDHVPYTGGQKSAERFLDAKELSRCLLYWLQTEAPRPDGGTGFPGFYLRPDITGTEDGFAKAPYIRESRRIQARFTVKEQHVSTVLNEGRDRAVEFKDSVGVGAYRIDLHPSTGGDSYIDLSSLPFQIPLGAMIPIRMRNLIPAAKNIGTTHITNGCYRLHPVEWNIGEAAGLLAGFCLNREVEPAHVYEDPALLEDFQKLLREQGIEIEWPRLRAL